jgi:PilZ domain
MAQEIDEGNPYLNALKQSASSFGGTSSATVPAPEAGTADRPPSDAVADSVERFQGSEKRRSPRYKCEGSAELCEDGCDVCTWASFSDISLHGCYVEAQATYPVGTALHLKLEANGVRVEIKGAVRVSYPYLGMGIAFVEISDENQARLRKLLSTITRSSIIMVPAITGRAIPASTSPTGSVQSPTTVADPAAVVQALVEFFKDRQVLMREGFLRILHQGQAPKR